MDHTILPIGLVTIVLNLINSFNFNTLSLILGVTLSFFMIVFYFFKIVRECQKFIFNRKAAKNDTKTNSTKKR